MKCVVIKKQGREIENLVLEEREKPEAGGEQIRVRVTATALNRADLLQRRGLYPAPPGVPSDIPGLEYVGMVDQVGEQATEWKGGERVFGVEAGGSYAEYLVTHQRMAIAVPRGLEDIEAAAVPEAFLCAHDALVTQGGMGPGDRVLIHAVAGGVGSAALQLAHVWGAQVVGTAGSEEKMNQTARLAPFLAVNYREEDFQKKIEQSFGPNAIDIVFDTVGAAYWQKNLVVLKTCGTLIVFGFMGGATAETAIATILFKRLRILGTALRARPLEEKIQASQAFAHQVVPLLKEKRLRPVVDSTFPLEKVHEATEHMEKNKNTGKIVLTIG